MYKYNWRSEIVNTGRHLAGRSLVRQNDGLMRMHQIALSLALSMSKFFFECRAQLVQSIGARFSMNHLLTKPTRSVLV